MQRQHFADTTISVSHYGDGGHSISLSCPAIIRDYNQFTDGVDFADQYMCYY